MIYFDCFDNVITSIDGNISTFGSSSVNKDFTLNEVLNIEFYIKKRIPLLKVFLETSAVIVGKYYWNIIQSWRAGRPAHT